MKHLAQANLALFTPPQSTELPPLKQKMALELLKTLLIEVMSDAKLINEDEERPGGNR